MAIDYAPGGTVQSLMKNQIQKRKYLKDEECAQLIKGILLGVKHLHKNDYVHRDLKPSNIVIQDLNNLVSTKLVDFGLAVKDQTRQGFDDNCGTLAYKAPEQMSGDLIYSKSVDIWAVGFIMYELISLRHPLWDKHSNKESYREKVLNFKKLKFGSRFTRHARNLIQTLCHAKPSCRYTVD